MQELSVSVVIPAFNAASTICRAVDSAMAQSEPAQEIIVVEDGSDDDLQPALRRYGNRIRLLRKEHNGVSSARNAGIDAAMGEIIAFLDADDYWEPDKLVCQRETFRTYPQVGLVAASYYVQEPGSERVAGTMDAALEKIVQSHGALTFRTGCALWTGTVAVRRSVLGNRRFDSTLTTAEDRDLWIRLLEAAPHYIIARPLATHVFEPGSLSQNNPRQDYLNMLQIIDRYEALLSPKDRQYWEALVFRGWAGTSLTERNYGEALRTSLERLKRQPLDPTAWWVVIKSGLLNAVAPTPRCNDPRIRV
jgi:glycosyltransferase involved in cell wall biosynthesis